jgi:hypothetical protein
MRLGSQVEVRSQYDGAWVSGFEVAGIRGRESAAQIELRRCSDGSVLPAWFTTSDVREVPAN